MVTIFLQHKTIPTNLRYSPDGKQFVTMARDRKVIKFHCLLLLASVLNVGMQYQLLRVCCMYSALYHGYANV